MSKAETLITAHLDTWTSAIKAKSSAGRGSGRKREFYGVSKLRELILELGVRGLLVPQDPNEEPATELLKKAASQRKRLQVSGELRKSKESTAIEDEELPFNIPESWVWARFPEVCFYSPGKTPSTKNPTYWESEESDAGYPWASISDMEHYGSVEFTSKRVSHLAAEKVFKSPPSMAGTILMSFKLTVGKISKLEVASYHNEAILSITPYEGIFKDYIFKFLPTRALAGNTKRAIMGDTLNATSLALVLIPIPPLAEQHRIVAKVDELIALCDQLEQQQEDSVRTHASLVETLLGALTAASERGAFAEAWQRIASHFDTLFTTESSIEQLKQTILQLAVMGKLVEQDPEDEPAAVLLKKIASEQAKLAKAGTIKSEKFAPQISEEEFSIQIPNGWALARFQALPLFYHVGLDRGKSEQGINKKYRYFKMNNILNTGGFDLSDIVSVDASEEEVEKFSLASGDLLFNTRNSQELVGKTCVFRDDGNGAILYNNNILRARFSIQPISVVLDLWMRSPAGKSELEKLKSGTTNVWAIYQGKLEGLVCPIPPLAEQYRIVAKVDELMALCDRLKTSLQSAQTTKLHLADNLVEAAIR